MSVCCFFFWMVPNGRAVGLLARRFYFAFLLAFFLLSRDPLGLSWFLLATGSAYDYDEDGTGFD